MGKSKQANVVQPKPLPTVVYKPIPKLGGCKNC